MNTVRSRVPLATALFSLFLCDASALAQTPVADADRVWGPGVFTVFERPFAVHGIAGDTRVVFVAEAAFEPQVHVLNRFTRRKLGSIPAPEGGLNAPLYVRTRDTERIWGGTRGQLILLDAFRPDQIGTVVPKFYVYNYEYRWWRGFDAELIETHAIPMNTNPPELPPNGFFYPASFDLLPDGSIVVLDLFSLWVSGPDFESWRMAITSPEFGPGPYLTTVDHNGAKVPGFYMAVRDENWNKVRVPYQAELGMGVPFLPPLKGVTYIDVVDKVAFNRVATPGGIFWLDREALMDPVTPPFLKPYEYLVAPETGLSDLAGDIAYDHCHPDSEWVYWQRTASEPGQENIPGVHPYSEKWSPIYRVNVLTGEIQFVAESWQLYDFPTVLSTLPPIGRHNPYTYLLSSNVMEERIAETNVLLDESNMIGPTIVPIVLVDAY